jgi:hypothetical protein
MCPKSVTSVTSVTLVDIKGYLLYKITYKKKKSVTKSVTSPFR